MVNINQLMQKLDEQLDTIKEVKDATGVSKKLAAIDKVTDDKFGELGKLALANALAEVGKAILTSRGQSGPRRKTTYKSVPLSGDARASLAERGVVTFPGANVLIRHTISQDTRLDLEKLISD